MKKYIVEIYCPAIGKEYDMLLPMNLTVSEIKRLIVNNIEILEGNQIFEYSDVSLYYDNNKEIINDKTIVKETKIKNGEKLIII